MSLVRIIVDESQLDQKIRAWEKILSEMDGLVSRTKSDVLTADTQRRAELNLWNERHSALLRRVHALEQGAPARPSLYRRILRWFYNLRK